MKWSFKIAKIAGIDVKVHSTFFLLIIWIGVSYWITQRNIQAALSGILFIVLLFLFVVLHEFGHALTARKYGIPTKDITLLPIGGVARLERMPEKPKEELIVAIAGPLVNLFFAVVLFTVIFLTTGFSQIPQLNITSGTLIERLAIVNLSLFLFNLIPAFPMDGGRIVRALLAMRLEYTRATQTAAALGQGIALIFGLIGLLFNPFLLFIAFFVWIGASQESSMVQVRSAMSGIPIQRAMLTRFQTLNTNQRLSDAAEAIIAGYQQDFPVVDMNGQMVGILTRKNLMHALATEGQTANISSFMDRNFITAESGEMLETVSARLQTCGCNTVPILENNNLIGLVTMENIGEFLMIQSALKSQ
ncbi:MAG: site-2 protease family protein [Anaerolineaceae bacterium]|nr:site-2 protease family protein [Anaerolineaceae bacterium]